jgi:hypothetical protein
MKPSIKYSTLAAAVLIAFFSIYASVVTTFMTQNHTSSAVNVTLNLQSGASQSFLVPPGQQLPLSLNGDNVMSMTIFGATVPAGVNAIVGNPSGSAVKVMWTIIHNPDGSTNVASTTVDQDLAS